MRRVGSCTVVSGLLVIVSFCSAWSAVPSTMNVQGRLTDSTGTPLPAGNKTLSFSIHDDPSAGAKVWPSAAAEDQVVTTGADGLWTVYLGSVYPLTDVVFSDSARWLEVTVDDGSNPAVTLPRTRLMTGPYAYRVATVDGASGGHVTSKVTIGSGHTNTGTDGFVAGLNNSVIGDYAAIGGGKDNAADDYAATVSGGEFNKAPDAFAAVAGGSQNNANGGGAFVGGGVGNTTGAAYATIGGGTGNYAPDTGSAIGGGAANAATGLYATVSGGRQNTASGAYAVVGGGGGNAPSLGNTAAGERSVIGGGFINLATGFGATISGGGLDTASGSYATIAGGYLNHAAGSGSAIGGGGGNGGFGAYSGIGGGLQNSIDELYGSIGGGIANYDADTAATIGGGSHNRAWSPYTTVGGGARNEAGSPLGEFLGPYATVAGGRQNVAEGRFSFAGGGDSNHTGVGTGTVIAGGSRNSLAFADWAVIGGGEGNKSDENGHYGVIGGGQNNINNGGSAVIGGGFANANEGSFSTIGGGEANLANGIGACIPGGISNEAGAYAFAAGYHAKARDRGSFVWADFSSLSDFVSTDSNQVIFRAAGGLGVNTNSTLSPLTVASANKWRWTVGNGWGDLSVSNGTYGLGIGVATDGGGAGTVRVWPKGGQKNLRFGNSVAGDVVTIDSSGNVGIGTSTTTNILTIQQFSATDPVADVWAQYSSRRWKTNIEAIDDPLGKIGRLRGVEFDWKKNGRHDIGLIAEEVGEVIPEIVQFESNGIDAQSVDYARLVALLIEGMKAQQRQIEAQQEEIESLKSAMTP